MPHLEYLLVCLDQQYGRTHQGLSFWIVDIVLLTPWALFDWGMCAPGVRQPPQEGHLTQYLGLYLRLPLVSQSALSLEISLRSSPAVSNNPASGQWEMQLWGEVREGKLEEECGSCPPRDWASLNHRIPSRPQKTVPICLMMEHKACVPSPCRAWCSVEHVARSQEAGSAHWLCRKPRFGDLRQVT